MAQPSSTSVSLILRVASESDVAAWEQFLQIYQPLVYRIAIQRGLQDADAHDLVQEVMSRVARSVSDWNPDPARGSFRGWISRIARNLVIDFLRHNNRLPKTGEDTQIRQWELAHAATSYEANYFDLECEKQIFHCAAEQIQEEFMPNTWEAFWRTAVNREAVDAVSAELGMSRGAIYIARSRVMARLKETVQNLCDTRGD